MINQVRKAKVACAIGSVYVEAYLPVGFKYDPVAYVQFDAAYFTEEEANKIIDELNLEFGGDWYVKGDDINLGDDMLEPEEYTEELRANGYLIPEGADANYFAHNKVKVLPVGADEPVEVVLLSCGFVESEETAPE